MKDNDKNLENRVESKNTSNEPEQIRNSVFDSDIEQIDDSELPQSLKDKFKSFQNC